MDCLGRRTRDGFRRRVDSIAREPWLAAFCWCHNSDLAILGKLGMVVVGEGVNIT